MKRPTPPYAAFGVIAATVAVFAYFSCSGSPTTKEAATASSTPTGGEFNVPLGDGDVAFEPEEATFQAQVASSCADISVGSTTCGETTPVNKIGQGQ